MLSFTNKPVISTNITVGALNLQSGATLTIGSNTFTINGAVSGTGTLTGTISSNLAVNGTGTVYFTTGSNNLNDFVINSAGTVTLGTALNVAGSLTPTAGTFALGSSNVTLKAGTNGEVVYGTTKTFPLTGIVGLVGGIVDQTGSGRFVVERYIPARRSFRFIASSVNTTTDIKVNWMENAYNAGPGYGSNNNPRPGYGTHITGSAAPGANLDWTLTNNPSLFNYNNATQTWNPLYNSNGTLAAGYPYRLLIRGNRGIDLSLNSPTPSSTILRDSGTIVTGNVTLGSISSTPATMPVINGGTNTFSYIANPYAAPVNWHQIYGNSTNISPTYYAYDPNVNTKGAYVSYNASIGLNQYGNFITSKVDSTIQPGQAFMIETTGPSPLVKFNEAYKVALFTAVWRTSSTSAMPKMIIQLSSAANGNVLDGAVSVFDNQFPATIGKEDSYKFTNLDENISIASNAKQLSMEGRPLAQVNDSIPLKIWQFRQANYFLNLNGVNFDPAISAVVKDRYLNIETPVDLSGGNTQVGFSITGDAASSAANRFVILFKPTSTLPLTLTGIKAYQKDKGIQVDWTVANEITTDHYEVEKSGNGQRFDKSASITARHNNSTAEFYGWLDNNPIVGSNYYRIKIVDRSGDVKYSRIAKVDIGKVGAGITVYPNPVQGGIVHVQFANLDMGVYNVILYNSLGEKVFNNTVKHNGGSGNYSLNVSQVVSKGTYRLVITNGDTEQTESVIFE